MDMRRLITKPFDFTNKDTSGWDLSHNDLSGCSFRKCVGTWFAMCKGTEINFKGADITNSTFEKSEEAVLRCIMGSSWNGVEINQVSGWLVQSELYWCFATNAFVQIGCVQDSWDDITKMSEDRKAFDAARSFNPNIDLDTTWKWWQTYKPLIEAWRLSC